MNKFDRLLLNKVNIFMAECYENNTIISAKHIGEIFKKIFEKDVNYIQLCPHGLEKKLYELAKDIYDNEHHVESFKEALKVFFVAYYDTVYYQNIKLQKISSHDKDIFWYKSFWGEFILQNLLYKNVDSEKFSTDYKQIGSLIGMFYKLKENDKGKAEITKNIIISKLDNIYKRYDYIYPLPSLELNA
ncbi:hypothetical protein [uncultured Clostridium sp.]|uniref:hypothetical protein n=1 Tax=uncultured Clostridium sp. TaxID=59620 RepID=UPI0028EEC864|nr:hypothetical protein [uncultured Clostridium sp.]